MLYLGLKIARIPPRDPNFRLRSSFMLPVSVGKSMAGACWRAGSLLFLRKSQEQPMCHVLACVTRPKRPEQPPAPAQGGEEHWWDPVPLRTWGWGPAPGPRSPLTAIPEGVQLLLPSPWCRGGGAIECFLENTPRP